jgi:zinc transporter 2
MSSGEEDSSNGNMHLQLSHCVDHPADQQLNPRLNEMSIAEEHCHSEELPDDTVARNQLIVVSVLCFAFMIGEVAGGLLAHSLAIATDATHMASDLASFLVSLFAMWLAKKPATIRMSFGYYRAEVLGAMISILTIWVITAVLVYLAVLRIRDKDFEIHSQTMLITASVGVAFNIVMGLVLHGGIWEGCHVESSFGHGHSHGGQSHGEHSHGEQSHSEQSHSGHSHGGHLHGGQSHSGSHSGHSHGEHSHSEQSHSGHSDGGHLHGGQSHSGSHSGHSRGEQSRGEHSHGGQSHSGHAAGGRQDSTGLHINGSSELFQCDSDDDMLLNVDSSVHEQWNPTTCPPPTSDDDNMLVCAPDDENVYQVPAAVCETTTLLTITTDPEIATAATHGDRHRQHTNINVRAALIHVIGDLIQSIGVLVAAIIIHVKPEYAIVDPICTFLFSFLVLCTTINVLRDVILVIMEGVPRGVDYCAIKTDLEALDGVEKAHSLNVWALTVGRLAVGVHLAVAPEVQWPDILTRATILLRKKYKVHQSTIQVEYYQESVMNSCSRCQNP